MILKVHYTSKEQECYNIILKYDYKCSVYNDDPFLNFDVNRFFYTKPANIVNLKDSDLELNAHWWMNTKPQAPIFHNYDDFNYLQGREISCLKLPKVFRRLLPEKIKSNILDIDDNNLDIFFTIQPVMKENDNSKIFNQYKPHYYYMPNTNHNDQWGHKNGFSIKVNYGLFTIPNNNIISTDCPVNKIGSATFLPHGKTLSPSTANIQVNDKTIALYSIVKGMGKNAVSLHWLLSDKDIKTFSEIIKIKKNLGEILLELENKPSFANLLPSIKQLLAINTTT